MIKVVAFLLLGIAINSSALDLELAAEGPCSENLQSMKLDPTWFQNSSTKWYNPLITKYEMYRYAEDIIGRNAESITDQDLKSLCPTYVIEQDGESVKVVALGAGGLEVNYDQKAGENDTLLWRVKGKHDWEKSWITKVGADYFLTISCYATGQRSFSVNSRSKTVDKADMTQILEHVKSLGFVDPKYYYSINYDNCEKTIKESYCIRNCLKG